MRQYTENQPKGTLQVCCFHSFEGPIQRCLRSGSIRLREIGDDVFALSPRPLDVAAIQIDSANVLGSRNSFLKQSLATMPLK